MDLNAPLGKTPRPPGRRIMPIAGAVAGVLLLGGFGAYLFDADPHGGEPYAVAVIPPPPPVPARTAPQGGADTTPTGSIGPGQPPPADAMRMENGVKVVSPQSSDRGAGPRDTGPLVIDVSKALDSNARKAAPPPSPVPSAGDKAASAEDMPRVDAASATPKPRIAIFVSGMGLNPAATMTAIDTMPAAVDLAFVPTGASLGGAVNAARARGHEILLQLPMQNADGAALGPHALRPEEAPGELARDMVWLMGRFDGYAGVTNLLGAPVTASAPTMTAILKSIGQRGFFYLDDGTSRRSLGLSLAAPLGVPAGQADVVLDATADPAVVQANLDRLAAIARSKGSAIGMASGLPDHLPAIARFAADLDAQGLTLVPVSVIAGGSASLATTR